MCEMNNLQSMNSDKQTKINLAMQQISDPYLYKIRENFTYVINGKTYEIRIATFFGDSKKVSSALTQQTYLENKEYCDSKISEALAMRAERIESESWVVCALTYMIPYKAFKNKSIPLAVYKKIDAHYETAEDREEYYDDFSGRGGWVYDANVLEEEARKVATPSQLALAEKINARQEERRKKEEERRKWTEEERASTISEAKSLATEYNLVADWSWDDFAFSVGKVVKETAFWKVHEYVYDSDYHPDSKEKGQGKKVLGYTLKQKNESVVGIVGFGDYSSRNPLELSETHSPPAVNTFKEMIGA